MSDFKPNKRALSIGIDKYPHWPADKQLNGCVNDVRVIQSILQERFLFPQENLTLLANEEATQARILAALDALVAATQKDDIVVVHYAGHGSQMTDMNGDEPSGYDSTLVPHDSPMRYEGNSDITDDVLEGKLAALGAKTSFITLIFDCCHSGSVTRDAFGPKSRTLPPDTRSKEELSKIVPAVPAGVKKESGPSGWLPIAEKYVMIAGCRDDETSFEYTSSDAEGRVQHGALTYFLARELRKVVPGTTYRDVFERAAANVSGYASTQHPQMEGKADREVLGVKDIEPVPFARVLKRADDVVTLAAGAAHGMTKGSTYAVHAQGTKLPTDASKLGEVELVEVGAVTTECRLLQENEAGTISADARAFETAHAHGDDLLRVRLVGDPGPVAALRAELEKSRLLQLTEEGEAVVGQLLPARDRVAPGDPVPTAGVLRSPMWAFTSETGAFLMPLKKVDETAVILRNLEGTSRYRRALTFENANPDSQLAGKFDLQLMRMSASGELTRAEAENAGGQVVYDEGDVMVFRITSDYEKEVFISLVNFEMNGAVTLLLPWKAAKSQTKLAPQRQFDYETAKSNLFYATWPKGFPFVEGEDQALEGQATESVKLFITEQETDFSLLQQQKTRGGAAILPPTSSKLSTLFDGVFQGNATRGASRHEPADGDWTTVKRSYVIRRRRTQKLADDKPVQLGSATLVAQGLAGTVTTHFGRNGRIAAAALLGDDLRHALAESGIEDRQTVEIAGAQQVGPASRSVGDQPAMELQLTAPAEGFGQMVMATDELGVVSWHVATAAALTGRGGPSAGPLPRTYLIPRSVPAEQPAGRGGLLGPVGMKVLKELVFPLIDPVMGEIGAMLVHSLEKKRRPYRVRTFQPDDFTSEEARNVTDDDWKRLSSTRGRALLFVHGTWSRSHLAFGKLPVDYMAELHARYGGRVFAFDHFTLSHDPRENIKRFLATMPDGTNLDVDIICHSRGGLVSRMLSERVTEFDLGSRQLRVGRVVFVGAPNAGTPLADPKRLGDLVDVVTNLVNFLPGVGDTLTLVIGVVKQLAVGATSGLDGLVSMDPEGEFLKKLNTGERHDGAKYFAVSSDAKPAEPGLRRLLVTKGLNKLMAGKGSPDGPNDLVVPTNGVFDENGSKFFPIEDRLRLEGSDDVSHTTYFENDRVRRKMLEWLPG